jgi:BirA family transcriptional regulator, biotin operon repressor / biotin---[acetyl-CoA-carboxylase] ligase
MSVVLRELSEVLPLTAAVAVCEALPVMAAIKWPNDVWIGGRKVAGILVEGRPQEGWAVLGVGLNVTTEAFPDELAEAATSLRLAGASASVEGVLADMLHALDRWLGAPPERVLEAWRARDELKGERVRWADGEGIAGGIDDSGALVVETRNGRVTLDAGEVHLRR